MKKYLFMAVAAIAAISSCSSDNDLLTGEAGKKALTFTATMEGSATRATFNRTENCAQWEKGDQICVNGKTYSAQSAGLTTTFKAATLGQEATGDNYTAYFPATLNNNGTPTLPAEVNEKWVDGKFNMPMYATSTNTELEFKNLCGVLKITVKNTQIDQVKKIRVSSATRAVSGAFTVTDNAAVLKNPSTIANTLTVTYTNPVTTTAEGKVFYVAVPAQTYQQLKIELSADGTNFTKSMTTKSGTNIGVERSKIYPITFANQQYSVTFDKSVFNYGSSTASAKNEDVRIDLSLTTDAYSGAQVQWIKDSPGSLTGSKGSIQIRPRELLSGVTITKFVFKGSKEEVTFTGSNIQYLSYEHLEIKTSNGTELGRELVSVTVDYTKQ